MLQEWTHELTWDLFVGRWIWLEGRRREALFLGFWVSVSNVTALGGTIIVLGAGLSGLDTTLPDGTPQPESAVLYIRAIFAFFCPLLSLGEGLAAFKFPIKGERLEMLEEKQASAFKRVRSVEVEIELVRKSSLSSAIGKDEDEAASASV